MDRELSEYGYIVKKSKYPRVYELENVIMHNGKSVVTYGLSKFIETIELYRFNELELELAGYKFNTLLSKGLFWYSDFKYYVLNFKDFSALGIDTAKIKSSMEYMIRFLGVGDIDDKNFILGIKGDKYNIAICEVVLPVYLGDGLIISSIKGNKDCLYARLTRGIKKGTYFLGHMSNKLS